MVAKETILSWEDQEGKGRATLSRLRKYFHKRKIKKKANKTFINVVV